MLLSAVTVQSAELLHVVNIAHFCNSFCMKSFITVERLFLQSVQWIIITLEAEFAKIWCIRGSFIQVTILFMSTLARRGQKPCLVIEKGYNEEKYLLGPATFLQIVPTLTAPDSWSE